MSSLTVNDKMCELSAIYRRSLTVNETFELSAIYRCSLTDIDKVKPLV